jgi:enoyl-CoA hydratase/carnithine racemase
MSMLATGAAVLIREDEPPGPITRNRPDKRNALSLELTQDLIATLQRASTDPGSRVIVPEAAGPAFSARHNLSEMSGRDVPFFQRLFDVCTELMETIHRLPQPVIAKVHGIATAAGCQLVAACDSPLRPTAPASPPRSQDRAVLLRRRWSRSRARSAASAGATCCSPAAPLMPTPRRVGPGHRVVPTAALEDETASIVDAIARSSPLTVGIGKEAFYAQIELDEHRLRPHKGRHGHERPRRRRPGRHERLPGEAPPGMARTLSPRRPLSLRRYERASAHGRPRRLRGTSSARAGPVLPDACFARAKEASAPDRRALPGIVPSGRVQLGHGHARYHSNGCVSP